MQIVLYSTGCPRCDVLKKKLTEKGVHYSEVNSVENMLSIGIKEVPVLSVDGNLMNFKEAVDWINNR